LHVKPFTELNCLQSYQNQEPPQWGKLGNADMVKILVVEDDPFVREMAVTGLEDAGYAVVEAASGGEALRLLQAGIAVDVLLTDIRLPEANGWVVAKAYRERFPDLPVLYVTGYAEQMQPVPGGIILSKPYKMSQVIGVLGTWAA
jgi:CheY-like chemotaxis protein